MFRIKPEVMSGGPAAWAPLATTQSQPAVSTVEVAHSAQGREGREETRWGHRALQYYPC